jgi:alginate O-acetyltransferase complex protein AlgI
VPFTGPVFLLVVLPAFFSAYVLAHAVSPRWSAWLLLAAGAAIVARDPFAGLTLAVIGCHVVSCAVDLRRGQTAIAEPVAAALYLVQFPVLPAGPLVRITEFSGQLAHRVLSMGAFAYGVRRVVTGLVKVLLIAGVLAVPADRIFALPASRLSAAAAWFAALCFALQVYFHFSGYADIAVGLGRMLGFRYPENFRRPYTADSLREFWRRWNVTLITWLRDYLRLPIVGHDAPTPRLFLNMVAGFCMLALWHRPAWTAIPAGVYFAALLAFETTALRPTLERWPRALRHVYVLVAITVGWVMLRAETPAAAATFVQAMIGAGAGGAAALSRDLTPQVWLALALAFIGAGPLVPAISRWRVSVDAATASLLMMLAATGVFLWRPGAVAIGRGRDRD